MSPGNYTYSSNVKALAAGMYFATLQSNNQAESAKILKQK
jgi:hypothetical protein